MNRRFLTIFIVLFFLISVAILIYSFIVFEETSGYFSAEVVNNDTWLSSKSKHIANFEYTERILLRNYQIDEWNKEEGYIAISGKDNNAELKGQIKLPTKVKVRECASEEQSESPIIPVCNTESIYNAIYYKSPVLVQVVYTADNQDYISELYRIQ